MLCSVVLFDHCIFFRLLLWDEGALKVGLVDPRWVCSMTIGNWLDRGFNIVRRLSLIVKQVLSLWLAQHIQVSAFDPLFFDDVGIGMVDDF